MIKKKTTIILLFIIFFLLLIFQTARAYFGIYLDNRYGYRSMTMNFENGNYKFISGFDLDEWYDRYYTGLLLRISKSELESQSGSKSGDENYYVGLSSNKNKTVSCTYDLAYYWLSDPAYLLDGGSGYTISAVRTIEGDNTGIAQNDSSTVPETDLSSLTWQTDEDGVKYAIFAHNKKINSKEKNLTIHTWDITMKYTIGADSITYQKQSFEGDIKAINVSC